MKRKINELTVEELTTYKKEQQSKIDKATREYKTAENRLIQLNSTMKKINEALDEKTLKIDDIQEILEKFPETEIRRKLLHKYLKQFMLDSFGYWVDTNQSAIKICLYKNNDEITKKVHDGILQLLPFIKPFKKDNSKRFDIFEKALSYHHSYYLAVYDNDKFFRVMNDREDPLFDNESLMEILKYIQKNLYYEKNYPM